MRKNTIAAAALLALVSAFQTPALAQSDEHAKLQLAIVDETNAPLPNANVSVFTLDGNLGRTVTADEYGLVVVADLPVGLTQVWVRTPGHRASAEATRLKAGDNKQTVTLHTAAPLTAESSETSGE
jgi:hypothetical protein